MGKSRKACIAGVCILLAVVAVASFFIGYKVAVDKNKTSWTKEETEYEETKELRRNQPPLFL